jgi:NAD(P)-dependent dehydrogenase (short-subunit alcohol dehydrogenase family)
MHNPLDLSGKRFVVTGASSGIGRCTAVLISRLGGRVACVDRDEKGLSDVHAALEGDGHAVRVQDLLLLSEIPAWMAELGDQWGRLDGLVHSAGLSCSTPLQVLEPEAYRKALTLNTEAGLALARAFQRRKTCAPNGGSIVFISSVMALVGSPTVVGYSMTKAALIGMAKSMAVELAPRRIRVNCIAPGFVKTPMYNQVAQFWDPGEEARLRALHPLGWGEPEDVANAIAYLLADTGRWVTGSVLTVDGGYTAQ